MPPQTHTQAVTNRLWSRVLLEELSRFGVRHVCVAPGSRSTPLTLEAHANAHFTLHTHFDERGLGFLALGLAKASQQPVAIVVTSGTAVANLLPAVAEAKLTGEPLVVLSADRPPSLVDCGANQAINQIGLFSTHVTASLNLPIPAGREAYPWLLTSVDNLMASQQREGGAVHINCPFPEPLYLSVEDEPVLAQSLDTLCPELAKWTLPSTPYSQRSGAQHSELCHVPNLVGKKGVVVVGSVGVEEAKQAKHLADTLGWPVFCDPQSGVSSPWAHYDLWLQNSRFRSQLASCECVLQFGSRLVSKRLLQWIAECVTDSGAEYHYVSPHPARNNPNHLPQHHHEVDIGRWIEHVQAMMPAPTSHQTGWAEGLLEASEQTRRLVQQFNVNGPLSEVSVAMSLESLPDEASLFIGNSLIVRLADMFTALTPREVLSNRGASGIDGLIATAAGVVRERQTPTVVLLGDTSALYDLNSLALFHHEETPVVIVITNNDGGAIFDLLPVPDREKQALYQMPHGFHFEHAAAQFGLAYRQPKTLTDYQHCLATHLKQGSGALILEVVTPAGEASSHIRQCVSQIHAL
ncbi:2-succinyl-5-enolpyruvyl-6-hydroxy-3-cyclohexene-1-carboxylic-acid synthase [Vibrio scophthalmi]|uniref:2-succinyl-5-enolpyruvyl-6-hydroxy-3- cyclohexene-1-carboxylic-acid synthase n=1 Tax=Vibrio scophthalmi TaxID=45658 RepID=UPI002FF14DEC